jgi:hypothetical protein
MLKLDLKRLKADIEKSEERRTVDPGGRRLTGAMASVRDHLREIVILKASGKSWPVIAAGLAKQGVTQGDNTCFNRMPALRRTVGLRPPTSNSRL